MDPKELSIPQHDATSTINPYIPRVLITGATGFIGAHVVHQALEAGYPVRITSRPAKVDLMIKKYGNKVEITPIADIGTDDLTDALSGIGAIIHVAAGMPGRQDAESMINSSINGALNVLKHAAIAKVSRIVITSSFVTTENWDDKTVFLRNRVYTDKDWNTATKEQILDGSHDNFWNYTAVKTLAEREIWKFAEEHPEIDITTINPPYVLGPFAPGTEIAKGDISGLSSNRLFLNFVLSNAKLAPFQIEAPPQIADVRDVARAHILALKSPLTTQSKVGQKKRLLIGSPVFFWKDAVELLNETRAMYKGRLSDASEAVRSEAATIDNSRLGEVLGLNELTDWKDTVQDTADALMEVMNTWD